MHFFFVATFFILSMLYNYPSQCSSSDSETSYDSDEWNFMTEIAPLIGKELTQDSENQSPQTLITSPQNSKIIELSEISTKEKSSVATEQNLIASDCQMVPLTTLKNPTHISHITHKKQENLHHNKNHSNKPLLANINNKHDNPSYKTRKKYIVKNTTSWIPTIKTCLQCLCYLQDDAYSDEEEEKKE